MTAGCSARPGAGLGLELGVAIAADADSQSVAGARDVLEAIANEISERVQSLAGLPDRKGAGDLGIRVDVAQDGHHTLQLADTDLRCPETTVTLYLSIDVNPERLWIHAGNAPDRSRGEFGS